MENTLKGVYYICAIGSDGITYYYHSDNTFRWSFCYYANKCFKTWKHKSYAQKKMEQIRAMKTSFTSISLMFCEYGKSIKENSIKLM